MSGDFALKVEIASDYAAAREDALAAAGLLQNHEAALRAVCKAQPARAARLRRLATELFDSVDALLADAPKGGR